MQAYTHPITPSTFTFQQQKSFFQRRKTDHKGISKDIIRTKRICCCCYFFQVKSNQTLAQPGPAHTNFGPHFSSLRTTTTTTTTLHPSLGLGLLFLMTKSTFFLTATTEPIRQPSRLDRPRYSHLPAQSRYRNGPRVILCVFFEEREDLSGCSKEERRSASAAVRRERDHGLVWS